MAVGRSEHGEINTIKPRIEVNIFKPHTDKRVYRRVAFFNSLEVLLISDPDIDKVSAMLLLSQSMSDSCFYDFFFAVTGGGGGDGRVGGGLHRSGRAPMARALSRDANSWNWAHIHSLQLPWEASQFQHYSDLQHTTLDNWIWELDPSSQYTVKTGYKVEVSSKDGISEMVSEKMT